MLVNETRNITNNYNPKHKFKHYIKYINEDARNGKHCSTLIFSNNEIDIENRDEVYQFLKDEGYQVTKDKRLIFPLMWNPNKLNEEEQAKFESDSKLLVLDVSW